MTYAKFNSLQQGDTVYVRDEYLGVIDRDYVRATVVRGTLNKPRRNFIVVCLDEGFYAGMDTAREHRTTRTPEEHAAITMAL